MKWYDIKCVDKNVADIYLYDEIASWGISANDFRKEFNEIVAEKVVLHVNSPGGGVFEGLAIYNLLSQSDKTIVVQIEGLAASIASLISMAGEKIIMAENSMLMLHNPLMRITGDSNRLKRSAELMDEVKKQLVDIYSERSGLEKTEIESMMDAETWMTAKTAKKKGFCDEVSKALKIAAFADIDKFEFHNQAIFETLKSKMRSKGEKMDLKTLSKILGVEEAGIENKIENMQNSLEALETEKQRLQEVVNNQKVELAIVSKKIAPREKEFALKMLAQSEEVYNEWLNQKTTKVPDDTVSIADGDETKSITYEKLLDDTDLHDKIKNQNPSLYSRLYNEYIGG
jgi:ATP-dependent Clp endopeptidase proteolytic subunit ClpP